jgi:threonine-phosphate decarboxylase
MIDGHGDDAYKYEGIQSDFSSNICPHASHQDLMAFLASSSDIIDHYPEPESSSLEKMVAERHDLKPNQVIVTSGATEAIYLIAQAFRQKAVIPQPTFSEYGDACQLFPRKADTVSIESGNNKSGEVLWLCNPNNPTGEVYDQLYIDRMMTEYEMVVIDQSYENYTHAHVMNPRWGARTPYSIQIHSMTKNYGVPGLRLGYITAHESLTNQIRKYIRPWSVSSLAIEAGKYLLQHDELLCKSDLGEAQRLAEMLRNIGGIFVQPSQTNFMLCQILNHSAAELKDYLIRKHGMLIRDASNFEGLTPHHFRIAAQLPAENDALVEAIKTFMKKQHE